MNQDPTITADASINTVNIVLLIILASTLFAKYILKLIKWIVDIRLSRDTTFEKRCIYLQDKKKQYSCELHYGTKYLDRNLCQKKKCPAYRTSTYSFQEWSKAKVWRFLVFSFLENISELVSVILIAYNLLR